MWENITEPNRPQMTIQRMRIACWITKATDTHLEYVILLLFRCNNGYVNVPQCFVIRTLPVWLVFMLVTIISYYLFPIPPPPLFFLNAGQYPGLLP